MDENGEEECAEALIYLERVVPGRRGGLVPAEGEDWVRDEDS